MAKKPTVPTFWFSPRFIKLNVDMYNTYGHDWFRALYSNGATSHRYHRIDILGTELLKEMYGDK